MFCDFHRWFFFYLYTCVFVYLAMGERDSVTVGRKSKPLYLKNNDLCCSSKKKTDHWLWSYRPNKTCDWRRLTMRPTWSQSLGSLPQKYRKPSEAPHTVIDINNVSHQFYDTNLYTSGATSVAKKTLKLRICGLPSLWPILLYMNCWTNWKFN